MNIRVQADQVLVNAERDLRRLISAAAEAGQYEDIAYIARLAARFTAFGTEGIADGMPREMAVADGVSATTDLQVDGPDTTTVSRSDRTHRRKYPLFYREGERLVKVGWSRSQHEEYEHKAGKAVLIRVVEALQDLSQKKRRFDLEALGQLSLGGKDGIIPVYQVYLCAAWLRSTGLLIQNGRKGYALASRTQLAEQVEREWEKLEAR